MMYSKIKQISLKRGQNLYVIVSLTSFLTPFTCPAVVYCEDTPVWLPSRAAQLCLRTNLSLHRGRPLWRGPGCNGQRQALCRLPNGRPVLSKRGRMRLTRAVATQKPSSVHAFTWKSGVADMDSPESFTFLGRHPLLRTFSHSLPPVLPPRSFTS